MDLSAFSKLFSRAAPPIHVLMELRHPDRMTWLFTNDNRNIEWQGRLYKATAMRWEAPESNGGVPQGGSLEITVDESSEDAELLRWFDMADDRAEIAVRAIINEDQVTELETVVQRHGTVSWNGRQITWEPSPDDRFGMHLNPWALDQEALFA